METIADNIVLAAAEATGGSLVYRHGCEVSGADAARWTRQRMGTFVARDDLLLQQIAIHTMALCMIVHGDLLGEELATFRHLQGQIK